MVAPPFQPVGVYFAHIRCNGLPGFLSLVVTEIVPAPLRFGGKGVDWRKQIRHLLPMRAPVISGQLNTAQVAFTPFIDNGVANTFDFALQKKRFKVFRKIH